MPVIKETKKLHVNIHANKYVFLARRILINTEIHYWYRIINLY